MYIPYIISDQSDRLIKVSLPPVLRAIPQSLVCSNLFLFFFISEYSYVHVHITRLVRRDPSMPDEVQAVISRLTSGCYAIWKGFSESPTSSTSQKSVCVRAGRSCRLLFLSLFSCIRSSCNVFATSSLRKESSRTSRRRRCEYRSMERPRAIESIARAIRHEREEEKKREYS